MAQMRGFMANIEMIIQAIVEHDPDMVSLGLGFNGMSIHPVIDSRPAMSDVHLLGLWKSYCKSPFSL